MTITMPPENVYVNAGTPAPFPQPAQAPTANQNVPIPPPQKSFPKIVIWLGIVFIVIILGLIVFNLLKGISPSGGQITWWGLWEDPKTVQPLIDEYQQAHSGVKITYVAQSQQDYRERLTSALAKGGGPDIFSFHNSWVPMFKNDLDVLPASVMNPSDYAKTFYPIASSDLTSGSGIVGIPLEYDALTLFINQDIFDKEGKTPPTSWDGFRSTACSLTHQNDQGVITQAGAAMGRTENVDHWPEILALLMIQNNADLNNPTGETAEGALTFFVQFSTNAACKGGANVWDSTLPSSTQMFASGKLAMYLAPSWRAFEIQSANPNLKFKTVPVPQLPKDNPSQPDITYASYWAQGVSAKSANKSRSWDFLKFLSTQDSLTKLFTNAGKIRSFGEPYPRPDMAGLLLSHPVLGSIVAQAPGAQSWFLYSRTFDGPTGINSQLINYFGDAVNAVASGNSTAAQALQTAAAGVKQVLAQYRLAK